MGHAGAIISAFGESAQEKVEILKGCRRDHRADAIGVRNGRRKRAGKPEKGGLRRLWASAYW